LFFFLFWRSSLSAGRRRLFLVSKISLRFFAALQQLPFGCYSERGRQTQFVNKFTSRQKRKKRKKDFWIGSGRWGNSPVPTAKEIA
jgi:hypothetical protein